MNYILNSFGDFTSINNQGDYHSLYVKSDICLANVFEDFRSKCLEIHKLDPAHFL